MLVLDTERFLKKKEKGRKKQRNKAKKQHTYPIKFFEEYTSHALPAGLMPRHALIHYLFIPAGNAITIRN